MRVCGYCRKPLPQQCSDNHAWNGKLACETCFEDHYDAWIEKVAPPARCPRCEDSVPADEIKKGLCWSCRLLFKTVAEDQEAKRTGIWPELVLD